VAEHLPLGPAPQYHQKGRKEGSKEGEEEGERRERRKK
jgi:hypothetical protein